MVLKKKFNLQSFTYFIPAPPVRQSGYREKHFDRLLTDFLAQGFDLIEMKTESISSPQVAGMWVICLVRPTSAKAASLKWDDFQERHSNSSTKTPTENPIEGFYYIHDHAKTGDDEI